MADPIEHKIFWYSPDPRAILPNENFKVSRSLKQILKKNIFEIKINSSFEEVIRSCADRTQTWISEGIIKSYIALYRSGYAHSVEAWYSGKLVGGLYGVTIGSAYFGESMFSKKENASKVCLCALVDILKKNNFQLHDIQYISPHLIQFGAVEIPRIDYLTKLKTAISIPNKFP